MKACSVLSNKVKQKKCRVCKGKFDPFQTTQVVCGTKCALELAVSKRKAKERKSDNVRREKLKTASDFIKEAQASVNRYIRARDADKLCVSCVSSLDRNTVRGGMVDAGHYRSRGAASHLRFNLLNIHGQCKRCNQFLGGNYSEYRKELINRIGLNNVESLENNNDTRKFDVEYLKRIKKIFNKRARFYEKRARN